MVCAYCNVWSLANNYHCIQSVSRSHGELWFSLTYDPPLIWRHSRAILASFSRYSHAIPASFSRHSRAMLAPFCPPPPPHASDGLSIAFGCSCTNWVSNSADRGNFFRSVRYCFPEGKITTLGICDFTCDYIFLAIHDTGCLVTPAKVIGFASQWSLLILSRIYRRFCLVIESEFPKTFFYMQKSGNQNGALHHNHESEDCPWFSEYNHKYVDDMFRKKRVRFTCFLAARLRRLGVSSDSTF